MVDKVEDKKISFLYKSIEDSQAVVRAVDVKASFLFAVNLLPITALDKIFKIAQDLYNYHNCFSLLIVLVLLTWLTALYLLFKTVVSISNPAGNIKLGGETEDHPSGIFYMPLTFKLSLLDSFIKPSRESLQSLSEKLEALPSSEVEIVKELTFEKMKVAFIRDIKINRLSLCFKCTFLWLLLGSSCWLIMLARA